MDEPPGCEHADHAQRKDQADQPPEDREPAGGGPQHGEVELVAGEQEQEPESQVDEGRDADGLGPPQDVGADDDAADEEDDHLGQMQPGEETDDDRGPGRDQGDGQQGAKTGVGVHLQS